MANSSLRDRIRHLNTAYDLGKIEIRIIWFSTLVSVVTAIDFLAQHVGPTQNFDLRTLKSLLLILVVGTVGMVVLLTLMACLIVAIRDRDKDVVQLKLRLKQAYSKALAQSSFNPHLAEPKHEQPARRTRQ